MSRSIAGTQWKCTNSAMPQHGMTATVVDGDIDPDWNGENKIAMQYQGGKNTSMTMLQLQANFRQVIRPQPTNVTYLHGRAHVGALTR